MSSFKIKSLSRFSWDFFACVLIASSRSYKAPAWKLRGRPSDMPLYAPASAHAWKAGEWQRASQGREL
jgi:hypothetical protein